MSKKFILVLVEGTTDRKTLYWTLCSLFSSKYGEKYEVAFQYFKDFNTDREGGDVTAERKNSSPRVLEQSIKYCMIDPFLRMNKLDAGCLAGIIQISDTDGTFIPNDSVVIDKACIHPLYSPERILTANRDSIIERNKLKSNNMLYLSKKESISLSTKKKVKDIPYSYHYFSCELETVLYGKYNSNQSEKIKYSDQLHSKGLAGSMENDFCVGGRFAEFSTIGMTYEQSWEHILTGKNSLSRVTNINTLFDRVNAGYFD